MFTIEKKKVSAACCFFDHKSILISKAWLTCHIQVSVQCDNFILLFFGLNCRVDVASVVSGSVNDVSSILLVSGVL